MKLIDELQNELGPYFAERAEHILPAVAIDGRGLVMLRGQALIEDDASEGVFWPTECDPTFAMSNGVVGLKCQDRELVCVKHFQKCPTELGFHYHFQVERVR